MFRVPWVRRSPAWKRAASSPASRRGGTRPALPLKVNAAVTEMELKFLHLLCLPLFLTACQKLPPPAPALSTAASEGQAFAQASCGGCHAVGRSGTSPNPNAPPFHVVVNHEGVTAETLSFWLSGAHNYPREMDFYLRRPEVDKLVAYMITLRDPNYRRAPD